jgi:hypothetical protein
MDTVRGYREGTSLLWVRRSTESASGVQRPPQQRADGECAELALRAHQSFSTVRALFLPTAFARVRPGRGRIGRLCSERAACRGMHVGGIEPGRCGSRAVAVLSEGTLGHAM